MQQLIKRMDDIIRRAGPYGTIPARQYKPAGQQPIAQRCPPGQHAHGGFGYCHEEQRQHRQAHAELHQEAGRIAAIDRKMHELGDKMTELARAKKPVPPGLRRDFSRLYSYLWRIKGKKKLR